ncbi:MAG TPA: alpha/beta hydrolase-fold protein [Pyrinomonadaceae bacterium]
MITSLLLLILASVSARAGNDIRREKFESEGKQRTYYLFVPSSVDQKKPVPLVVLLHGSGRNGLTLVERWKDLAESQGFIIVGPDSSNGESWRMPQDGPEFIYELVEMLIKKYPIASDRLYLFGHSAGAVVSLDLGMLESEYFAAVAVHAGAWRTDQDYQFIEGATRKTPVRITVGDRDSFFPLESVRRTEKALKTRGFEVVVSIITNHTHNYYEIASDVNRDSWQFLKEHTLGQERRHVPRSYKSGPSSDLNSVLKNINDVRTRANDLLQRFYAEERRLQQTDFIKDNATVLAIAQTQVQILTDTGNALREAAAIADKTRELKIANSVQKYFSMVGQAASLRADAVELLRNRAELLLSPGDLSTIVKKRSELGTKADALAFSAEQLEQQAEKLVR